MLATNIGAGVWQEFFILLCILPGHSLGHLAADAGLHRPALLQARENGSGNALVSSITQASHATTWKGGGGVQVLGCPSPEL